MEESCWGSPEKAVGCQEGVLTHIKALLDTNPLVKALEELGLDRTEPAHTRSEQDHLFKRMQSLSRPDKVIVIHDCYSPPRSHRLALNVYFPSRLTLHQESLPFEQPIDLHCFTGTRAVVEDWLD